MINELLKAKHIKQVRGALGRFYLHYFIVRDGEEECRHEWEYYAVREETCPKCGQQRLFMTVYWFYCDRDETFYWIPVLNTKGDST